MKGQEVLFSKKSDEWETPQKLFDDLNDNYNFTLDVCATAENAKCKKFFTVEDNGLEQSWKGHRCWCNPPYSKIYHWALKAVEQHRIHEVGTLMLLPARTDTLWFHAFLYHNPYVDLLFLKGRLKFSGAKNSAPFPSMLAYVGMGNV